MKYTKKAHNPRLRSALLLFAVTLISSGINVSASAAEVKSSLLYDVTNATAGSSLGFAQTLLDDVDADGVADWLVSDTGLGSTSIYSGATGSLLRTSRGQGATYGIAVFTIGDLDADGFRDYVVGEPRYGNGTQGAAYIYSGKTGALIRMHTDTRNWALWGSSGAGLGDVNGDGVADYVISSSSNKISVGCGNCLFSAVVYSGATGTQLYTVSPSGSYEASYGSTSAVVGDIDGDGILDFMVSDPDAWATDYSGTAYVYSGKTGKILLSYNAMYNALGPTYKFGDAATQLGDLNGDGYPEFAIGAPGVKYSKKIFGYVNIYSGNKSAGNPLLAHVTGANIGDGFGQSIAKLKDIDGDGVADFAVGAPLAGGSGAVVFYSGASRNVLATLTNSISGSNFGSSILPTSNDLSGIVISIGHPTSVAALPSGFTVYKISQVVADQDADGIADSQDNCPAIVNASQLNNDGDVQGNDCDEDDDNDLMPDVWETRYGLNPLVDDAAGDLDGDGFTNLQEYQQGTNPQSRSCARKNDYTKSGKAGWVWKGDSNGVETQSQIWQLTFPLQSSNWGVPNRFYPPQFPDQSNWEIVTTGDFNGDCDADFLWRHKTTGKWRKIWQIEKGTRSSQNELGDFYLALEWQVAGAGDTDNDGDDDVILGNTTTGEVMIWEMEDYAIAATHNVGIKAGYRLNRIGNFNSDGDMDLLFRETNGSALTIWEIENNAFVAERSLANTGTNYNPVCAGDFDNDGDDDIMLINSSTLQEKWFVMENYTRTQAVGATNAGFVFKGCGDYDGDGDADTLWQRSSDDMNRVVLQQNYGANKQTVYTNAFGGEHPDKPGYGFVHRGNSN